MKATVICISHVEGAEGGTVGRAVAEKLGYAFADDAIVSEAARAAGIFAESEGVDAKRAVKELSESDKGRAVYLQRFYDVKNEQPTDYDLVLNTEKLGTDVAAALIVAAGGHQARKRSSPAA